MTEKDILRLGSILILCVGIYVCLRPATVAKRIKAFYSSYPIIRYPGEKQLTVRPHFVVCIGIVLMLVAVLGFFSV